MTKSAWDGSELPEWWVIQPSPLKSQVIVFLQGHTLMPPLWWGSKPQHERRAVVWHLCAVGSVNSNEHARVRAYGLATFTATRKAGKSTSDNYCSARIQAWRNAYPQVSTCWFDESTKLRPMLYSKPNGGKRALPSIYTKLTNRWLRGNGVYQSPESMNQGHLKNTVALLNESHVNLMDRMMDMLGRMHNHLGNRPDLQAKLVDLYHDFEILQVDELYPIVELLASYIQPEEPEPNPDGQGWLDDDNYPF